MNFLKDKAIKNAILIGVVSAVAYLICYFARNILSVMTPQIIDTTDISEAFIGTLSTVNMLTYAGGQLVNGIIGDKVKAKYLVSLGLILSGVSNIFIGLFESKPIMLVAYGFVGFFLSMIYAPLTKLIAENAHPRYAVNCCLGLTLASLLGVPVAGITALFFNWDSAFVFCGIVMILTGSLFYISIALLEKKNIVKYQKRVVAVKKGGSIKVLIENEIIKFSLIAIVDGIVRTSVVFWVPTYLSQYLGYSVAASASIYTVMTCVRSVAPYVGNLIIYERIFKRRMNPVLILSFALSTASFVLMFAIKMPLLNIIFLCLALMTDSIASNLLWSVYCPSLRDTGMVSSATGYLDFLSYAAAGAANVMFANAISTIGWGRLILVWAALMGVGVDVSIPWKKMLKR